MLTAKSVQISVFGFVLNWINQINLNFGEAFTYFGKVNHILLVFSLKGIPIWNIC